MSPWALIRHWPNLFLIAALKGSDYTTIAGLLTAIGGIITGFLAWNRNRKTDKLALYSQFVDDLHEEVDRLRKQYEEDRTKYGVDRQGWSTREAELTREIELLKEQTARLERDLGNLKGRTSRSATVRKEAQEDTIADLETALAVAKHELELMRASTPNDVKKAARSIIEETMRQMGIRE